MILSMDSVIVSSEAAVLPICVPRSPPPCAFSDRLSKLVAVMQREGLDYVFRAADLVQSFVKLLLVGFDHTHSNVLH